MREGVCRDGGLSSVPFSSSSSALVAGKLFSTVNYIVKSLAEGCELAVLGNRIEVRNLGKAYSRRPLFADISLTIPDRTALVVHGPNGSGKTTFLHLLCGLIPSTTGKVDVYLHGRALSPGERRRALGLVSPDLRLYDDLTAAENLAFFSAVRGFAYSADEARGVLERVGLKVRGHELLRTFSAGMKQRMKYACALWHRPHILLLDEPTSNLDAAGVALVWDIVEQQRSRGIVVIATNEREELRYGDQTLVFA